jgi:putative hemolysin
MRNLLKTALFVLLAAILLNACSQKAAPTVTSIPPAGVGANNGAGLANPASVNCEEKGGKLEFRERSELGQYGICVFEDNLQCEEWALLRGECPEGGIKVTGFVTEAAVFCAITGGEYAVTSNSGAADEQGTCTFKDSTTCDVWEYFGGKCYPVR